MLLFVGVVVCSSGLFSGGPPTQEHPVYTDSLIDTVAGTKNLAALNNLIDGNPYLHMPDEYVRRLGGTRAVAVAVAVVVVP